MGKKTFTSGLSDLFSDALAEDSQEDLTILASSKTTARKRKTKTKTTKKKTMKPKKEPNMKSFASDLDSFFQDAITESVDEQVEELKNGKKIKVKKPIRRKPNFGLDNLIRQTLETSTVVTVKDTPTRKRVTFLFDKEKLAEFKKIVRNEKAYMKDIIGGLVSEYLEQYNKNKGKI